MIPVDTMDGAAGFQPAWTPWLDFITIGKPPEGGPELRRGLLAPTSCPTNACLRSTCRLSWHSTGSDRVQE